MRTGPNESRFQSQREALADAERLLAIREGTLAELEAHQEEREASIRRREAEAEAEAARTRAHKRMRHDLIQERRQALAAAAGESIEAARERLTNALTEDGAQALRKRARAQDERLARDLTGHAQRILASVTQRYDGIGHLERTGSTITIQDAAAFTALTDEMSPLSRMIADSTGCTWTSDFETTSITVHADDSALRELCRRALRMASTGASDVDGLRTRIMTAKEDLSHEVRRAGEEAFDCVNLPRAAPEILDLIGRLTFRLSHSQNQWKHSIEVAWLADMLAAELRSDRASARRGGLLHDMGKAMTHDHEGSHAVLGAAVARRCAESEVVANAIGAHHGDEPMATPTALLVTAADALSGARPGARRESATQYVARLRQIHEIARRGPLVAGVDIMHAGREVRVTVAPEASDDTLHPLANKIARALEDEVAFPGQIRVTVIRESRSSAIAR